MGDAAKAVFLSYASQDKEAAQRIADALRAAGLEVWFDISELRGGDTWDAKIRKQIKECALFVPIISATTNARPEGYFRLEWKLAVDRSHLLADDHPFLFPVVVGDVTDANARVPDKFREVQWTRLKLDETPAELAARIARLLSGDVAGVADPGPASTRPATARQRTTGWQWWMIFPILGMFMGLLFAAVPLWKTFNRPASRSARVAAPSSTPSASPARDWPENPELKKAVALLDQLNAIPEDFRLAEEIVQAVLDKSPTDPEAVVAMARVHSMWLLRGWNRTNNRFQKAKSMCERALQLAPDEPEALQAMSVSLYSGDVEGQRALELAQRAVELAPQEPRFYRHRDNCLFVLSFGPKDILTDRAMQQKNAALARAMESARRTTLLFPQDPLVHYELARHYRDLGLWEEFEKETDITLALAPVANAMVWKARARFGLHNDVPGMKAVLDQVPDRVRSIERTVFGYFLYSAYTGNLQEGLEALRGMTDSWMVDFDFRGPKALPMAVLLELDGKKELARLQYEEAMAELRRARAANPPDAQTYLVEAWIQHGLGHDAEARAALRVYDESISRPITINLMAGWWFHAIAANLLIGERATALDLMHDVVTRQTDGRAVLRGRFAMDRRMASFRDDPEIVALLAEPGATQRTGDRGQETAKPQEAKP